MAINAKVDAVDYNGIETISVGGKTVELSEEYSGSMEISANGTYNVGGKATAVVNVEQSATLGEKSITANGTYDASADNFDGYNKVVVNVETPTISLQQKTATANGEVVADSGYDGLSKVTVNVPVSGYDLDDVASRNLGITADTDVVLTTAPEIAAGAFMGVKMKSITSTTVKAVGDAAFNQNGLNSSNSVRFVNLPNCTNIEAETFRANWRLEECKIPEVTSIGDNAFSQCHGLLALDVPKCVTFRAICDARSIATLSLPLATSVGKISDMPALLTVSAPARTGSATSGDFGNCPLLQTVDMGYCSSWNANIFGKCTALVKVVLRQTSGVVKNTYTFGSGFTPANATLYVPEALVTEYQAHARWGTFGTITAIEGSEFDV